MGLNEFLKSAFALTIGLLMSPFMILLMIVQSRGKVSWKKYDMPDCLRDPAYGTHHFVHLEDVRLHYVAAGDEDKPLMLLVHGLPEFWFSWRYQIKEFKKYYRVVAIDQRGYSESGAPSGVSSYNLRELAKDIKQLVPALGYKSCVLVGHDWGGAVAWTVAGLHPEVVDKLIIMNCPPPQAYVPILLHGTRVARAVLLFQGQVVLENSFTGEPFGVRCTKVSPKELEAYKFAFPTFGSFTGPINYIRAMSRTAQPPEKKVTTPTLLIWGCKDAAFGMALVPLVQKVATSLTIKYVEDASHWVQMDCPDLVNTHMREF